MVIIRSRDGFAVALPTSLARGRKQWLRTWFFRDLIALNGAVLPRLGNTPVSIEQLRAHRAVA